MKNDNEWKELENWEEKRKNEELSKFGLNLSGMDMKKGKSNANKIVALMYSINLILCLFKSLSLLKIVTSILYFSSIAFSIFESAIIKL